MTDVEIVSVVNTPRSELVLRTELNSTSGAGEIGIADAGGYYDSTTVETALQEIPAGGVPFNSIQFNTNPTVTHSEGQIHRDDEDKTLELDTEIDGVHIQVGQENVVRVYNTTGSQINNGKVVYISGSSGSKPLIDLADADLGVKAGAVIGVTTCDIPDTDYGYVTTEGLVRGVNTHGYTAGDIIYLSQTAGEFTNTKPSVPAYQIRIGYVVKVSADEGIILVNIDRERTRFGGDSNYSHFEADGTLVAKGDATVYADIDFPIIIRTTGAGIPSLTTINGNITMPQWAVNDFNMCESQEFIHEREEGTQCNRHIHYTVNGLDATDRYVRRELEYGYTVNGLWTFPAVVTTADILIPANTPDKTQIIMPIANFTPSSSKIGDHCVARLKRVAASGTAPSGNPRVPMLQMHIKKDTLGSRQMTTK